MSAALETYLQLRLKMMSFMLTPRQLLDETKDVTRRLGWKTLKVGSLLKAVEKTQGLGKGNHPKVLAIIKILSVRIEPLEAITADDCRREGFPNLAPSDFVEFFCKHMKCIPSTPVTRIEFKLIAK